MTLTVTRDKTVYGPTDTMTLTIVSDQRLKSDVIDIQSAGDDAKVTTVVQQGIVISDPLGRKWTIVSDDGKTAIATAPATP